MQAAIYHTYHCKFFAIHEKQKSGVLRYVQELLDGRSA